MDWIESVGKQLSEVTMYDVKSAYSSAKAMVMNYSEMEQKVREATNDDAWGASSTLMNEIAQGTNNFQLFNEIMPTIYKRFTEKEARQWRQIYKALQLLEFLVKHGSERVVDDARSHISMIKILRNFHYIDEKGKDQGINVRNRSKELAEMLSDLERVRQERRKARANKNKYGGLGSEDVSFQTASRSRYGGFGSDSFAARSSSSAYESNSRSGGFQDSSNDREEYDAGDDDERTGAPSSATPARSTASTAAKAAPPPPAKEVNLFDFDDDDQIPAAAPAPAASFAAPTAGADGARNGALRLTATDDFDDFVAAPGQSAAPAPVQSRPAAVAAPLSAKPTFFDMVNPTPAPVQQPSRPQYTAPMGASFAQPMAAPQQSRPAPNYSAQPLSASTSPAAASKPAAAFDDLWSLAGGSTSSTLGKKTTAGPSLASLNRPGQGGIWQSSSPAPSQPQHKTTNSFGANGSFGGDDLLL